MADFLRHVSKRVGGGRRDREEDTEMQPLTPPSPSSGEPKDGPEGPDLGPGAEEGTPEPSNLQKIKGLASLILSLFMTLISYACVQLLNRVVPDFELNAIRYTTVALFFLIILMFQRRFPIVPKSELWSVCKFGILGLLDSICIYTAVTFIPLSSADAVKLTSGILSGILLFYCVLGERFNILQAVFALGCVSGVVCVTQPAFIFQHQETDPLNLNNNTKAFFNPDDHSNIATVAMAYGLAVASGVSISCYMLTFKRRSYISENLSIVLFWSCLLCAAVSIVAMAIIETPTFPSNWRDTTLVGIHAASFIINWPAFVYGFKHLSGNTVNIICCTTIVLMLIPQYTILSSIHPGHRNWIEVTGIVLVLLGTSSQSVLELVKIKRC